MRNGAGVAGLVVGIAFLIFGLVLGSPFAIIGHISRQEANDKQELMDEYCENGKNTIGRVTNSENGTTVEYVDSDGYEYSLHFNVESSDIYEGQEMAVFYDKSNAAMAIVPDIDISFNRTFGNIFFFVGIGVMILFGGLGLVSIIATIGATKLNSKKTTESQDNTAADVNDFSTHANDYSGIDKDLF